MLSWFLSKCGYVPVYEKDAVRAALAQARVELRQVTHRAEAQDVVIERMAARYRQLQGENAGVVKFLLTEIGESR